MEAIVREGKGGEEGREGEDREGGGDKKGGKEGAPDPILTHLDYIYDYIIV